MKAKSSEALACSFFWRAMHAIIDFLVILLQGEKCRWHAKVDRNIDFGVLSTNSVTQYSYCLVVQVDQKGEAEEDDGVPQQHHHHVAEKNEEVVLTDYLLAGAVEKTHKVLKIDSDDRIERPSKGAELFIVTGQHDEEGHGRTQVKYEHDAEV